MNNQGNVSKAAVLAALRSAKETASPAQVPSERALDPQEGFRRGLALAVFIVEQMPGDGRRTPTVRNSDRTSAHYGAARQEPTEGTNKAEVLAFMRNRGWVTNRDLRESGVGGDDPARRMRQLRAEGWAATRDNQAGPTQYRYMPNMVSGEQLDILTATANEV